jgi:hypothetical protein
MESFLPKVRREVQVNQIELSIVQTLKILWSFLWRGWVLIMPVLILMAFAFHFIIPFPKPGEPPQPPDIKQLPIFFLVWIIMMAIFLVSQLFALRWALKTKWSDFRIVAVSASPKLEG